MITTSEKYAQTPQQGAFAVPDHLLVATDLTDAGYLVPYVVAQAKASQAHVTLVHAILPTNSFPIESGAIPYVDRQVIDQDARAALLDIASQIKRQGVSCDVSLQHGFVADVVREMLHDTGATRVIMGTHGRGKMGQFALGSVANELLKTVDVPIFAVGPGAIQSDTHETPRKILHPVSLEGEFQKSLDFAVDIANAYDAELTLIHVSKPDMEKAHDSERWLKWTKNALMAVVPRNAAFSRVHAMAVSGKLVDEILKAAKENGADWIVLGVDGDSPLLALKDSTAYKVLAAADCPVLTIRHESKQEKDKAQQAMHVVS